MEDERGRQCLNMALMGIVAWDARRIHSVAMEREWRIMETEMKTMKDELLVREVEMKAEIQRGDRMKKELERLRKELEETRKNKEVSANTEWNKIERRIKKCMRSVIREETENERNE